MALTTRDPEAAPIVIDLQRRIAPLRVVHRGEEIAVDAVPDIPAELRRVVIATVLLRLGETGTTAETVFERAGA